MALGVTKPLAYTINILTRIGVNLSVCPSVTDVTSLPQRVLWERGYNVYRNASEKDAHAL